MSSSMRNKTRSRALYQRVREILESARMAEGAGVARKNGVSNPRRSDGGEI